MFKNSYFNYSVRRIELPTLTAHIIMVDTFMFQYYVFMHPIHIDHKNPIYIINEKPAYIFCVGYMYSLAIWYKNVLILRWLVEICLFYYQKNTKLTIHLSL